MYSALEACESYGVIAASMVPDELVKRAVAPSRKVPVIEPDCVLTSVLYSRSYTVARLLSTCSLPEDEVIESCAGCGLEESASPLSTETSMRPEEEVRTRRSRRVKAPVMGLEEVLRMVRRAVQWGRWTGVLWVVKDVVLMVG